MLQLGALSLLITILLAPGLSPAGELSPEQRGFLQEYLGISKKESRITFEISPLEDGRLYGRTSRERPRTVELNLDEFHRHPEDRGLRREGTIIHEVIHLIQYGKRPNDETWLQEGVALLGEFLYDVRTFGKEAAIRSFLPIVRAYLASPHRSLVTFDQSPADYGKSFLFTLYLHETFQKTQFVQALLSSPGTGMDAITAALTGSRAFAVTPREWKDPEVYVSQFFWSLLSDRNTLAVTVNDWFSQFLSHDTGGVGAPIAADQPTDLAPYGFVTVLPPDCQSRSFRIIGGIPTLYAIHHEDGKTRAQFLDPVGFALQPGEPTLFLLNPRAGALKVQVECAQTPAQ